MFSYHIFGLDVQGRSSPVTIETPSISTGWNQDNAKTLSTIFIYRQRSNSRAGIHTTVEHFSCSTLNSRISFRAIMQWCHWGRMRHGKSTMEESAHERREREQTKAGLSFTPVGAVLEWSVKSGQRSSRGLSPHLGCTKPSPPLCNTLEL